VSAVPLVGIWNNAECRVALQSDNRSIIALPVLGIYDEIFGLQGVSGGKN